MDVYFCSNGLGTNPYKLRDELEAATGKEFVMLQWQSKIVQKGLTKYITQPKNTHSKTKQRLSDFFDERDYKSEILAPLLKLVREKTLYASNIYFISYSTGTLIVEDIINELEHENINHFLIGSVDKGVKWVNPLEKGILIGKLFVPIGLLAIMQTRKLIKHRSKTWIREKLSEGTSLRIGVSRTILSSGNDAIVENINIDTKRIQNYCIGSYTHSEIGNFDEKALMQTYIILSTNQPIKAFTKKEILSEFLDLNKSEPKSFLSRIFSRNK